MKILQEYHSNQTAKLQDCQVCPEFRRGKQEIVLKRSSPICESDKVVDVTKVDFEGAVAPVVLVSVVREKKIQYYVVVSVYVKVCLICQAETLPSGSMKQDVVIADKSGSCHAIIWVPV